MWQNNIRENITRTTAYVSAIEEAEQFLWAGSEMDLVREMHNSLVQARKWAKSVRNCVSKLKTWSNNPRCDSERVQMNHVNELLKFSTPPCNAPRHIRLKEYKEEASKMIQEINSALTSCSEFSLGDLEILYVKAVDLPIHIKEIEQLNLKLSAVKLPARQEPVLDSSKYTAADVRITDQKLRVCDICGAFLSVYDSDRRLADHFGGKLHLGYMLIREKLAELQEERDKKRKAYEEEKRSRDQKSQDQERGSSKDRDRGDRKDYDHRNRDRDRNYGRNRGGGDRERVRERESSRGYDSRSHRRSRSRSRERSRDYDRNRRRDRN